MDSLLKKYNENRRADPPQTTRKEINEDYDVVNPFILSYSSRNYGNQFYNMYLNRLRTLKARVERECLRRWGSDDFRLHGRRVTRKEKVLDIKGSEPCWCIGTIYCEMKYKPDILREIINDTYGAPVLAKSYADPEGSDEIMLEDESGRVTLVGDYIKTTPFVTGVVVGLLGMEAEAGTFQVIDICYPSAIPQREPPAVHSTFDNSGASKVALVSGLNVDTSSPMKILSLKLLQEYLMGELVDNEEIQQIGKLIVCGNLIECSFEEANRGKLIKSLEDVSDFLANTLQSISVDLIPGDHDPSDRTLPQQPLNKALFRESLRPYFDDINRRILNLTTNPCTLRINDWNFLVSSGESLEDILKYFLPYQQEDAQTEQNTDPTSSETIDVELSDISMTRRLDLMECMMKWQNIAPTAPDTLWSYPFKDRDPFVLDEWPHIFVVGNQPRFDCRDFVVDDKTVIKIIAVPVFSKTNQIVLLDLNTLETEVVTVGA